MKYNKSEIMKAAWKMFKNPRMIGWTFAECLKQAWAVAKANVERAEMIEAFGKVGEVVIDGAEVIIDIANGVVSGKTFYAKKTLKKYGLSYNGTYKYWEGTEAQLTNLVADYAA